MWAVNKFACAACINNNWGDFCAKELRNHLNGWSRGGGGKVMRRRVGAVVWILQRSNAKTRLGNEWENKSNIIQLSTLSGLIDGSEHAENLWLFFIFCFWEKLFFLRSVMKCLAVRISETADSDFVVFWLTLLVNFL